MTGTIAPTTCEGCGAPISQPRSGRRRKWCSDRCRKVSTYVRFCVDCGQRLNSSDGNGPNAPVRCGACNGAHERLMSRRWVLSSMREWAEMFGVPPVGSDWNPRHAERQGMVWRAERLAATGRPWPCVTLVQQNFGSWNAAIVAAGFTPNPQGCYGRDGEDPAVVAETVRLVESGLSRVEVARRMGVSRQAIDSRLAKAAA